MWATEITHPVFFSEEWNAYVYIPLSWYTEAYELWSVLMDEEG